MRFAVALLLLMAAAWGGCGKKAFSTDTLSPSTFETAAPEIQKGWNKVLTAVKGDDYAVAILALEQLRTNTDLSAQQMGTVSNADVAVRAKMNTAARKGDPKAQKALEDLRRTYLESRGRH